MKFLSFEILYIFFNFQILKCFEIFELWIFFRKFWPPTDGISTSLPMEYWTPYPWYFDPPIHGISTPLPMIYWTPYPWYIDSRIHGILTPLPIKYRPPYTWYFDLPAYLLIRNGGFNLQYRGSVFNKGVQYTMDVNRPRVQFTMGFKIPYDTSCHSILVKCVNYVFIFCQPWILDCIYSLIQTLF